MSRLHSTDVAPRASLDRAGTADRGFRRAAGDLRSSECRGRETAAQQGARHRRGFTLVEMVVVITVASLMLSAVAVALHTLFRADRGMRAETAHAAVLSRLSIQFRSDAHAATAAEQTASQDEPRRLALRLPDNRLVQYEVEGGRLVRTARHGEAVEHREWYWLPRQAEVHWEVSGDGTPSIAALTIVRHTGSMDQAEDTRRVDRIEAAIGLDSAYTRNEQ